MLSFPDLRLRAECAYGVDGRPHDEKTVSEQMWHKPKAQRGPLYGDPYEQPFGDCAIYSETIVFVQLLPDPAQGLLGSDGFAEATACGVAAVCNCPVEPCWTNLNASHREGASVAGHNSDFASCWCRRLNFRIYLRTLRHGTLLCCNVAVQCSIPLFFSSHGAVDRCMFFH